MADAADSKSVGATHVGSTPTFGTNFRLNPGSRGASQHLASNGATNATCPGDSVTADQSDGAFGGWRACDVCGEPIATIEESALALRADIMQDRRAALAAPKTDPAVPPGLVAWDWGHRACVDALNPLYRIEGPRLDTLPRMMARTLQLFDEEWFLETAWEDAVRRFYRIPFE